MPKFIASRIADFNYVCTPCFKQINKRKTKKGMCEIKAIT